MPRYKCLKSLDSLIEKQKYTETELLELYHEATIISLVNAGVLEKLEVTDVETVDPEVKEIKEVKTK
jgi:hypothetical protein